MITRCIHWDSAGPKEQYAYFNELNYHVMSFYAGLRY